MVEDGLTAELARKQLFRDDVVLSASQPGVLGSVVRFSGDPGSDSEDSSSSDDEQAGGQGREEAEVLWLNATEPVGTSVAELRVVDRALTHNDTVVWGSSPLGQMGKVVDINILVDLEMADGNITQGIDSKMLRRVRSFATGDIVVKGSWVGRVVGLEENVTVVFKDGTRCKVLEADPETLVPNIAIDEDEDFPYYPGQKVRARTAKIFRKATWLAGSWKPTISLDAAVVDVETAVVIVEWFRHRDDTDNWKRAPEEEQKPKGLTALLPFPYAEWGLGDRCVLGTSACRIVNTRTKVDVLWQNGDMSCGTHSYELIYAQPSGENDFWPRQYVTEKGAGADGQDTESARVGVVKRIDSKQRTAVVQWIKSGVADEEEVVGVYELAELVDGELGDLVFPLSPKSSARSKSQRPWVGCIRRFTIQGDVEVIWQDGSMSTVKPHEVKIQAYEDDSSSSSSSDSDSSSEDEAESTCHRGGQSDEQDVDMNDASETADFTKQDMDQAAVVGQHESCETFKQFGIAKGAEDHHFFSEAGISGNHRAWAQRVQKEWSVLERHLPQTIYVRVYEDRMDLLTAVIVGPDETPYQDGLYVFDICLPHEYPHVPPRVHYRSGGLRINPNLYENGKVCLSLLNTWRGKESEVWNPKSSNILQVLLSIQGLVLIQNPFFNEPDFDRQKGTSEGEQNCVIYNESCFLSCCKSMLYLLRRPPRHFETLVTSHFRQVGSKISQTCKAYIAGTKVGCKPQDPSISTHIALNSEGFRLALDKLVMKLEAAFSALH